MTEILLGGIAYGMRCDMNVIEKLDARYGGVSQIPEKMSIADVKFMAAEMINEHNYSRGDPARYSPEQIGAMMTPAEFPAAKAAVMECFVESWTGGAKKKDT